MLAFLVLAIVAAGLAAPVAVRAFERHRAQRKPRQARRRRELRDLGDPGRERRAEQRARELLSSCVNEEEWAMYRDLGFIRVLGHMTRKAGRDAGPGSAYAYLIYPHKPIVAYVAKTGRLLSEYCVEFPDLTGAISQSRLPDSDDVLAKWMALTGDEERLIHNANMHLPGRQVDPSRVRRDLWRLSEWERQRRGPLKAPRT
jgi:Ni/Co efflux regulator RcnB